MTNITVALSQTRKPFFDGYGLEVFDLMLILKSHGNFTIRYDFFKNCSCTYNSDFVDAFIGDFDLLLDCNTRVQVPPMSALLKFSILRPIHTKIPRYEYILMPFDLYVGFSIIFTNMFFGLVSAIISRNYGKFDINRQILDGILLILDQSTKLPSKKEPLLRYMYLLMIIFGIIFANLYSAFLSSFLVAGIPKPLTKIICENHAASVLFAKYPEFSFKSFDYYNYSNYMPFFVSEDSYCVSEFFYTKFTYFKEDMKTKYFRLEVPWVSDITYTSYLVLNQDSKHFEKLQNFIGLCYSSGITIKLLQNQAKNTLIYKHYVFPKEESNFLNMSDFKFVNIFLLCGLLISFVFFVFECVFYFLRKPVKLCISRVRFFVNIRKQKIFT